MPTSHNAAVSASRSRDRDGKRDTECDRVAHSIETVTHAAGTEAPGNGPVEPVQQRACEDEHANEPELGGRDTRATRKARTRSSSRRQQLDAGCARGERVSLAWRRSDNPVDEAPCGLEYTGRGPATLLASGVELVELERADVRAVRPDQHVGE
jgi:hypothetical protein